MHANIPTAARGRYWCWLYQHQPQQLAKLAAIQGWFRAIFLFRDGGIFISTAGI